ncbi:hypothetical protein FR943_21990 [Mycobacterium sp. TNTM28]|uniref:Lipoprotein LppV n=1 Tax=[Mycobacterium] fortunisiensis TaxID=2600579 RepID=A0ABS6KSG4_9MYCO|nr:LppA family lipoprotein [[Mycobacterium] fortunisiensis]MBU9766501.1 hypothetical protein [[Mycobacterium] fortunisiensis]
MWRLVITFLLAFALTGCGPMFESEYQGPAEGDYGYGAPAELEPLLARRDAEEVLADRDRMITEITAELSRIVPGSTWLPNRDERSSECGEFGSTDAERYFGRNWVSKVPVPAALWDQASQAVIDIAAKYGYTDVTGRSENPVGDQATDLTISDSEDGRLSFGSQTNAVLQVVTGCYLTAENKRKAREAAPK